MLVQDRLVLMWQTDINPTSERASEQLIEVATAISVSASDASQIALFPGRALLQRVGMDLEGTLPHAIDATTLTDDEMLSGGIEGWWKSDGVAEPWKVTSTAGSYAVQERAVDTLGKRWWWALMARSEPEGAFGKMLEGTRRQWALLFATFSPEDLSIIRQELSRYHWGCDFQRMPTSESPTVSAASQPVLGGSSVGLPTGGVLANPDVRRQWASTFATLSPVELSVVRQELIRYDSGCDFRCLSKSELPTSIPALFGCPGGILVWNGEDRLDGPIWTGVGLVTEVTLTFGNMGVEKRMWDCALQAESDWEWDCRAVTQETWVLGHTAAQAASLPDGAPMSHSHETHLSAAASLGEALNVGGSVLQTQPGSSASGIVAAMRLRGGGGAERNKRNRDEARMRTYEGRQGSGNWGGQQGSCNWGGQQGSMEPPPRPLHPPHPHPQNLHPPPPPAAPPAAAHAAFYAAAFADGAVRTPSPPAVDEAEGGNSGNWGGQQGSGNWGGWWGGIQGRGKWGGIPHALPPLRTGWGYHVPARHTYGRPIMGTICGGVASS